VPTPPGALLRDKLVRIGKNSAWYAFANASAALIGFAALPILTRLFTTSQFGIFSLINTALALGSPVVYTYLATSVIRFYPEYDNAGELDTFYSTTFHYMPHFMVLFLCVLAPLTALVLPLGDYRVVITLSVVVFALLTLFHVCTSIMRARHMSWQYAALTVFIQLARYMGGAALVAWAGSGVAGPFWAWLGALLVVTPIEFGILRIGRYLSWKKNSSDLQKRFFKFGFVLVFVTLMSEMMTAADRYMVLAFKGSYQTGLYSVIYTLVNSVELLVSSFIMMGSVPVVTRVYEEDGEHRAQALLTRITKYLLLILVPTTVALWVLRDPMIKVVASPKYLPAKSAVFPLVFGIAIGLLAWPPLYSFYLKKKTALILYPIGAAALSNILINLVAIPRYGFNGAAWATFISYLLYMLLVTAMGHRLMKWHFPWKDSLKVALATAVMAAALWGLVSAGLHGFTGLLLMVACGTVVYLAALLLLGGLTRGECRFALEVAARVPLAGRLVPERFHKKPTVDELFDDEAGGEGTDE
jgi:O-antigen/teichoic acid export membrane protein